MFDVSWTDPARETVGERRKKKEQNGRSAQKQNAMSRRSSMRSSRSSDSVAAKPSLLNIFGPGKSPTLDRARSQSKLRPEDVNDRRVSSYTIESEGSAHELSGIAVKRIPSNAFFEGRDCQSDAEQSNPSDPPDSVFSGWTEKSSRTESSWGSVIDTSTLCGTSNCIVQPLSPTSFVTQSTEVTISPRDSIKAEEQVATIVRITAAHSMPIDVQNIPDSPSKTASPPSTFAFPLPLPHPYAYPISSTSPTAPNLSYLPAAVLEAKPRHAPKKDLSLSPAPLPISSTSSFSNAKPNRLNTQQPSRSCIMDASSPIAETWKPPETWECPASSSDSSNCSLSPTAKTHPRPRVHRSPRSPPPALSTLTQVPRRSKERDVQKARQKTPPASTEILNLQRSMRRMEAASKKIMLERLREEWTEIADASVYRELELEKQMWMLTAMRSFDGRKSTDASRCSTPVGGDQRGSFKTAEGRPERRKRRSAEEHRGKVLSLFENHASACSLAAMVVKGTELHHLSTAPLSPKQYPNILPLTVPSATQYLPYASNIFNNIHAFCLPSLLPSSAIPTVLKECYRVLISAPQPSTRTHFSEPPQQLNSPSPDLASNSSECRGGTLHLTILDPSPLPGTLGPRLRTWLDDHLVLNLEKQFRCINPSRLFPDWLADAGLRADGSTVMYVKFFASVPTVVWSRCSSTAVEREGDDEEDPDSSILDEVRKEKQREKEMEDDRIKQELKSVVGRMLWKEIWGSYVQGEKWWWDDESVVDECERMGTVWEYAVIEAVKGE